MSQKFELKNLGVKKGKSQAKIVKR